MSAKSGERLAAMEATLAEMSKRLSEQAGSIKVLNEAHTLNEVAHVEIKSAVAKIDDRLAFLAKVLGVGLTVATTLIIVAEFWISHVKIV